jgi:hypothetical protein
MDYGIVRFGSHVGDYEAQYLLGCDVYCSVVEVYGCLGGTYCFHLQGQRVSQACNKQDGSFFILKKRMYKNGLGNAHPALCQDGSVSMW